MDNFFIAKKVEYVDLLKIDTEGYEYQVLKSLNEKIKKIKLIHFEHHYDDMIIKDYKFNEINNLLKKWIC